ncbi:DEAD/DEAH box helicase [Acidiferrimicrobium sp. IK]|uniref:DEAD/DEAH box helicase n=1 Tax=Acidiferrimicrobium sp. IK TaxID=2871700 RepID=UPI0021CB2066|nr:DEAD/DEAH box helicase [Acidiferrimicrobium sp. IK]MCU4184518.1 DEAD/DEAH box helicase [Acidiferrimicrobium sp. IK]
MAVPRLDAGSGWPPACKTKWSRALDRITLEAAVVAEATGYASPVELAALEAAPLAWIGTLRRLLLETDEALTSAARLAGEERDQVLADLGAERRALASALVRLTGEEPDAPAVRLAPAPPAAEPVAEAPAPPRLQASWADGRVVVWAAGRGSAPLPADELEAMLKEADAGGIGWEHHAPVALPSGQRADARSAALAHTLGWLVGVGAGQVGSPDAEAPIGTSLAWMGEIAVWGTELVASGRMVPVLRGSTGTSGPRPGPARHRVRWVPALVARDRLADLVSRMPGAVVALQASPQPEGVCRSILSAVVDAVSRAGADRLVAPATVAQASTRVEISEAVLSGLDGRPFSAEAEPAARVAEDLKRWAAPVTVGTKIGLTVRLDQPAADGGWLLRVDATGVDKGPLPVEHALVVASGTKSQQVEAQLRRLERLLPVLRRPSTRRGQVILDADEAGELMFDLGPMVAAAGFDVYLPMVSRRKPSPQLRLFAEAMGGQSQVGVAQLSNVRWSVFFDDLELDAAAIAKLASEARPLVQVKGRWVHIDRTDLAAAAAALAERAGITQLSGAALLRHAVGLEGHALGGSVRVDGHGWAVDIVQGATTNPPAPLQPPTGFKGQLRHYQAEAAGWLGFLDRAGLGGCLAMDMGLGKTPTLLAHLLATRGDGPALIVCPPAVLSNWAREAARFTPELSVALHHGPRRADADGLVKLAGNHDVVLTTYATAVRDIDALARVEWRRMAVDEAQAIKNHTSDTAQALRRVPARSRLALTGTPVENGLGDLWAILDFTNPGLVGGRTSFIEHLSRTGEGRAGAEEGALRALNGLLVFRRTKIEPEIAAELPDKVDKLDSCGMTAEQVGLYQAVLDRLLADELDEDATRRKGQVLAAITALKQICDHPSAYLGEEDTITTLHGRSGKLTRLDEIVDDVFAAGERVLIFTHFARWGEKLATYLTERTGIHVGCYHGGLSRTVRDELVAEFQRGKGPGALVLSIKAGGSGLNLTAARHVVLYDRWWNPAVEDQARDRAWRIGQTSTVVSHRLVCPGTVDERVEEIVAGKREVAGMVLPARSSLGDLDAAQLRAALGLAVEEVIEEELPASDPEEEAA